MKTINVFIPWLFETREKYKNIVKFYIIDILQINCKNIYYFVFYFFIKLIYFTIAVETEWIINFKINIQLRILYFIL